jgi:hypothetical protein
VKLTSFLIESSEKMLDLKISLSFTRLWLGVLLRTWRILPLPFIISSIEIFEKDPKYPEEKCMQLNVSSL